MPWVRLDDGFPDHPKVAAAGPLSGWLHVCGICYCNRHLTDGFIPASVAHRLMDADYAGTSDCVPIAEDLCEKGLWRKVEGGYMIHDYLDYQPSRADIEDSRAKKQAAGQAGGQASARARAQAKSKQSSTPNPSPSKKKKEPPLPPHAEDDPYVCDVLRILRSVDKPAFQNGKVTYERVREVLGDFPGIDGLMVSKACRDWVSFGKGALRDTKDPVALYRNFMRTEAKAAALEAPSKPKPHACHCGTAFVTEKRLAEHQSDVHGEGVI